MGVRPLAVKIGLRSSFFQGLDFYAGKEILFPFLAGLLFLTQVLLVTEVLAQADVLLGAGVSALDLLTVVAELVPHFLGYVLPVAFLLGAVLGMGRLAQDRELVALSAAGISPLRFVRVTMGMGIAVAALTLWVGLVLEPIGLRNARVIVNSLVRKNVTSDVHAGVFYEEIPDLMLYAEHTEAGRWGHVLISDHTDPTAPLLVLSNSGGIEPAGGGEEMRLLLGPGEVHREELHVDEYVAGRFQKASITLGIGRTISDRNRLVGSPFELGPRDIVALARAAKDTDSARHWWTFLHRRVAGPFAVLAFSILAVPIAASRRGGRAFGYVATLVAVVAYYAVLRFGEGLSYRGVLPSWAGPNLPNLVVAVVGVASLAYIEHRGAGAVR